MLDRHFEAWSKHPLNAFSYMIVDDCSPKPISTQYQIDNFSIIRINKDIPWNQPGARNLGFHLATTEWVLAVDIDHIITPIAAEQILSLDLSDANAAYIFKRFSEETGREGCLCHMNILMSKKRFFEIGGYDEDYSGNYGKDDIFFYHCLRRHSLKIIQCSDIVLNWHHRRGGTRGFKRDRAIDSFNSKIFDRKMIALKNGTYKNGPILRFEWDKIFG